QTNLRTRFTALCGLPASLTDPLSAPGAPALQTLLLRKASSLTAHQRLMTAASQLGEGEIEVLALVAERLLQGQSWYGLLRLGTDQRDFHREALEEVADGLVYAAAGLIRARLRER